jgi:hypothetical protein
MNFLAAVGAITCFIVLVILVLWLIGVVSFETGGEKEDG